MSNNKANNSYNMSTNSTGKNATSKNKVNDSTKNATNKTQMKNATNAADNACNSNTSYCCR